MKLVHPAQRDAGTGRSGVRKVERIRAPRCCTRRRPVAALHGTGSRGTLAHCHLRSAGRPGGAHVATTRTPLQRGRGVRRTGMRLPRRSALGDGDNT